VLVPLAEGGVVERVLLVARDITKQRSLLASLAEKERLASVGMVAASVAHEIMNPLTYVLANLDHVLAARGREETPETKALREAREGAKRMQQIVSDLRALGRAGGEERFYVDPRNVLETALRLSGTEIGHAALTLELREVPGVFASESRLCQVFINLLVNAAQAMDRRPAPEREITVRTRHDDVAGLVAVEISDRGVGIPPELVERIFEPFYTTKRAGTGLGLSISKDMVEKMGGRIEVQSTPGRGTTFTVWLSTTRTV
jgi:signal transduction histidine kinase